MRPTRSQLVAQQGSRARNKPTPVPLPFGGIDMVTPKGMLQPTRAPYLKNWMPIDGELTIRQGYTPIKSRTAPVSILGYNLAGGEGVFVVDGDDWALSINSSDGLDLVQVNCGLSSDNQLCGAQHSDYLCIVDGTNAGIKLFNGSTLSDSVLSGTYASYVWDGIVSHQTRLYLWQTDSLDFYYMNTDAVQGAITKFPLSFLGRLSGTIQTIASWTIDASQGTNDMLAIITTTGQVAVYEGSDPGDALNWRLNGVYTMTEVPGIDTWINVGGDLRVATKQGIVSASEMMRAGELSAAATATTSRGVIPLFRESAAVTGKERYWQSFIDPKGYGVWFNMPTASGSRQVFFSADSVAPFEFDLPAVEFASAHGELYFTTSDGKICKAYSAYSDAGTAITATWYSDWMVSGGSMDAIRLSYACENDVSLTITPLADFRESAAAIAEVVEDWQIENVDGQADEELPVAGIGDRLQVRVEVQNIFFEEVKWNAISARLASVSRMR